jgi:hypothetical protein
MKEVKNIPDVKRFAEVFPKNLLGLPPKRDVELRLGCSPGLHSP